jgi:hypothetical protein
MKTIDEVEGKGNEDGDDDQQSTQVHLTAPTGRISFHPQIAKPANLQFVILKGVKAASNTR